MVWQTKFQCPHHEDSTDSLLSLAVYHYRMWTFKRKGCGRTRNLGNTNFPISSSEMGKKNLKVAYKVAVTPSTLSEKKMWSREHTLNIIRTTPTPITTQDPRLLWLEHTLWSTCAHLTGIRTFIILIYESYQYYIHPFILCIHKIY